jgi:hypothetical protein
MWKLLFWTKCNCHNGANFVTDLANSLPVLTGSDPDSSRHIRATGRGVSATALHRPDSPLGSSQLLYVPSRHLAAISRTAYRWGLPLIKLYRPLWAQTDLRVSTSHETGTAVGPGNHSTNPSAQHPATMSPFDRPDQHLTNNIQICESARRNVHAR